MEDFSKYPWTHSLGKPLAEFLDEFSNDQKNLDSILGKVMERLLETISREILGGTSGGFFEGISGGFFV